MSDAVEKRMYHFKEEVNDLVDLGIAPGEIMMAVLETLHGAGAVSGPDNAATDTAFSVIGRMKNLHEVLSDPTHREDPAVARIRSLVQRLINSPKQQGPVDPQAKAMSCQVLLKSGYQAQGALSTTDEGTLRLLMPAGSPNGPVLAEHFFDYSEVEAVIVVHDVPQEKKPESRIIIPKLGSS